jgi:hypothetical protein
LATYFFQAQDIKLKKSLEILAFPENRKRARPGRRAQLEAAGERRRGANHWVKY